MEKSIKNSHRSKLQGIQQVGIFNLNLVIGIIASYGVLGPVKK